MSMVGANKDNGSKPRIWLVLGQYEFHDEQTTTKQCQ